MTDNRFFIASEHKGAWSFHILWRILQHAFPHCHLVQWEECDSAHRPAKPHLLVRATHAHLESSVFPDSDKIPYIMFSGESFQGGIRSYPPLWKLETVYQGVSQAQYWFPYFLFHPMVTTPRGIERLGPPLSQRPFFLVYIASNPCEHRNRFFQKCLEKHPQGCHGRGDCYNNYAKIQGDWSVVPHALTEYTFALVMENRNEPGYITEKIVNAYLGGCIPIYFGGGHLVKTLFHPDSFIDVSDFPSYDACIDHLVSLYLDHPEILQKMQSSPIFQHQEIVDDWYSVFQPPSSSLLSNRYQQIVQSLHQTFPQFTKESK